MTAPQTGARTLEGQAEATTDSEQPCWPPGERELNVCWVRLLQAWDLFVTAASQHPLLTDIHTQTSAKPHPRQAEGERPGERGQCGGGRVRGDEGTCGLVAFPCGTSLSLNSPRGRGGLAAHPPGCRTPAAGTCHQREWASCK